MVKSELYSNLKQAIHDVPVLFQDRTARTVQSYAQTHAGNPGKIPAQFPYTSNGNSGSHPLSRCGGAGRS